MLSICLRLACELNALSSGLTTPAHAEQALLRLVPAHHVADSDELLGMPEHDPVASVPVRMALSRIGVGSPCPTSSGPSPTEPTRWALLLPGPGRPAGLRGPAEVTAAAMDAGVVVTCHESPRDDLLGLTWIGHLVGQGVHWRLLRARRPLPPPTPAEASGQLRAAMIHAREVLTDLDDVAGNRPDVVAPTLGRGHVKGDQSLLDLAWTVLHACDAGLASNHEILTAHGTGTRERALRDLRQVAAEALTAAVSWPGR